MADTACFGHTRETRFALLFRAHSAATRLFAQE
jgi:hypothetical protein